MKKYWYKLLTWIGFDVEEVPMEKPVTQEIKAISEGSYRPGNVINLHQQKPIRVVLIAPIEYNQVQAIADYLRNMQPVIVNMEDLEKELAKRIMDFLSGTAYAISGTMQKINPNIVMVLPHNFSVLIGSTEKDDAKKDYLTWNNASKS
jgi:cell division inhibitor SepF